ncbi:uncharacterized protein YlxW (UPF0749 family) [Marmoricola sp. OAE513]|uniref:DUF881 domain-containing protein n=1 Tax=Marmoricola sp. OAE513 TaxID=2817894 RepID=UPI001AE1A42B
MAEQQLPERVTMGLLPYINAHALDEDYAAAAEQRERTATGQRRKVGVRGAAVLAIFAVLAVVAGLQTSRNSSSAERERRELISQVKSQRAAVTEQRRTIEALQGLNRRLEDQLFANSGSSNGLLEQVALLGLRSGIAPAKGPGVLIVADDAPDAESDRNRVLDSDLQKLVNGLWQAGAEAISINGERLTALSAIRHAGTAITVNFTSLGRPYRISAIGNPDQLPARFAETTSGQAWLDLQREVGLRYSLKTQSSLRLPGADVPQLRYIEDENGKNKFGRDEE